MVNIVLGEQAEGGCGNHAKYCTHYTSGNLSHSFAQKWWEVSQHFAQDQRIGVIFNMLDRMLIIMKLLTLHYHHKIELIHLCVYCSLMVLLRFSYELYYNGVLLALA